jgi:DNA-directed RNA polymerase specialized sigma24 family protein
MQTETASHAVNPASARPPSDAFLRRLWRSLAPWTPGLASPRASIHALANGYLLSARRRRARGDLFGAHADEACAAALLAQFD